MDFELDDDQRALRGLAASFAAREIAPHADRWSEEERFPVEVFRHMGQLGLLGLLVPESYGGVDAGMVAYVAAMEEIGAADQSVAAAWNAHITIASLPLLAFGTEDQKQRWLRPLAEGTSLGAFGLTEPQAGSDAASIRTRARRDGGDWVIDGTKMFITNAGTEMSAGVTLLAVTGEDADGKKRYGSFYVPTGTPGYTMGAPLKKLGWHAMDTRELVFEDCRVPADHLVGDEGHGLRQFLEVLAAGRISIAALSISLTRAVLALSTSYATERLQFGQPIGRFQAIGHKLADIATELEAARWLTYRAASLYDAGRPYATEAAMAKLFASEVANRAASSAVQIHGGYGFMRESKVARFYADAKILEIGEGTSEIQRTVIARSLGI
jgi:short/branched chain acyl-CoA dehydrogenase